LRLLCGERRSGGSAFQTTGAAMEKLRWPMDVLACETNRSPRPAERSDRRDKSETGQMTCLRYVPKLRKLFKNSVQLLNTLILRWLRESDTYRNIRLETCHRPCLTSAAGFSLEVSGLCIRLPFIQLSSAFATRTFSVFGSTCG